MKTVPFNLSIVATRYRKQKLASINQAFIFSSITQQMFKVKRTHLVKKKRNQRLNDIHLNMRQVKGYKNNYLKMHGR